MRTGSRYVLPVSSAQFFTQFLLTDDQLTIRIFGFPDERERMDLAETGLVRELLSRHCEPWKVGIRSTPKKAFHVDAFRGIGTTIRNKQFDLLIEYASMGMNFHPEQMGKLAHSECCAWMIDSRPDGSFRVPFNRTLFNYNEQVHSNQLYHQLHDTASVMMFFPFIDYNFNRATLWLKYNRMMGCNHNIENVTPYNTEKWVPRFPVLRDYQEIFSYPEVEKPIDDFNDFTVNIQPKIVIRGPDTLKSNSGSIFDLRIVDPDDNAVLIDEPMDVYIESDMGYLGHRKLRVVGGKSRFYWESKGLLEGDVATIRASWKYNTTGDRKEIRIV